MISTRLGNARRASCPRCEENASTTAVALPQIQAHHSADAGADVHDDDEDIDGAFAQVIVAGTRHFNCVFCGAIVARQVPGLRFPVARIDVVQ